MEVNAGILQRDFFCAPQNSLGEAALGLTAGEVSDSERNLRNDRHIH